MSRYRRLPAMRGRDRQMTRIDELRQQIIADAKDAVNFMPIMDPHPSHLRERAERLLELARLLESAN